MREIDFCDGLMGYCQICIFLLQQDRTVPTKRTCFRDREFRNLRRINVNAIQLQFCRNPVDGLVGWLYATCNAVAGVLMSEIGRLLNYTPILIPGILALSIPCSIALQS